VRRRGRGIPVVVVLFVALAFGITSSSADTAGIADTATAPIAADVSAGLQSFAQALTGLDGLNQLGQSLPFTSQTPAATNGLDFAHSFVDSLKTNLASHVPFNSLLELQTYLSTGIDSTYGGVTVHATGAIAPVGSLYTIDLTLDLSRTGTTPLAPRHAPDQRRRRLARDHVPHDRESHVQVRPRPGGREQVLPRRGFESAADDDGRRGG